MFFSETQCSAYYCEKKDSRRHEAPLRSDAASDESVRVSTVLRCDMKSLVSYFELNRTCVACAIANMTYSIKPEVHDILQRNQTRIKPRPYVIWRSLDMLFRRYARVKHACSTFPRATLYFARSGYCYDAATVRHRWPCICYGLGLGLVLGLFSALLGPAHFA